MRTQAWETITPEKAKEYLTHNTNNARKLSRIKAQQYAADIISGKWQENGEPIIFDEDGVLKDGQHRLFAVIIAGKPISALVVRGISRDVEIYNFGSSRTLNQMLHTSNTITGAARVLCGDFHAGAPKGIVADYIKTHYDDLRTADKIASYGRSHPIGKKAAIVLAVYTARRLQIATDAQLEEFFWIFNNQSTLTNQQRDPSPALIAARIVVTKYGNGSSNIQPKQMSVVLQAIQDFRRNKARTKEYKPENMNVDSFLETVRELDGIKKAS